MSDDRKEFEEWYTSFTGTENHEAMGFTLKLHDIAWVGWRAAKSHTEKVEERLKYLEEITSHLYPVRPTPFARNERIDRITKKLLADIQTESTDEKTS